MTNIEKLKAIILENMNETTVLTSTSREHVNIRLRVPWMLKLGLILLPSSGFLE